MKSKVILIVLGIITLFSCGKKDSAKLIDNTTGKEVNIKVNRFEDILFDQNQKDFKAHLQKNFSLYKPLFNTTLEDEEYFQMINQFASDTVMISIYNKVKKRYPNLDWVGDDITQGFARLKTYYPELPIPNLYTLIIGPDDFSYAYNSRIIATRDFISIAIDLYSIKSFGEMHYYSYFPKYMQNVLDSNYLTPDVFYTYLREVATIEVPLVEENPSPSLLEIMVERGKYLYAVKELLPSYELKDVLRYSQEEMKWAQENEYYIWSYLTQNRLLFEKDRTKYMGFITEGPTTRGIPNSPSRLGEYIGYKIVERYMEKNKLGIKELLETIDMEKILKDSGYKPKKK